MSYKTGGFYRLWAVPALVLGMLGFSTSSWADPPAVIHMEIVSAPVVPNGVVASEPTEFNVNIRRDGTDPATAMDNVIPVKGLQIPAGGRMEMELEGFVLNPNFADASFATGRNLILTTGPQNPVRPPPGGCVTCGFWGATLDTSGANPVVTVTPNGGAGDDGLEGERAAQLGFKVIHLRPDTTNRSHTGTPLYNGEPNDVGTIYVRIYNDEGHLDAAGSASIRFKPRVGPQVHLTNVRTRDDNSVNSNTNFQHVAPNTVLDGIMIPDGQPFANGLPYAPQFLLFADFGVHDPAQFPTGPDLPAVGDDSFIPFPGIEGVTVVPSKGNPMKASLVQYGTTNVGKVVMHGPSKKSGGNIMANDTPTTAGGNGSVLFVPVTVGDETGLYTVTVYMNGGGSATNTIVVE